jgi:hypothetical protein
MAIKCSHFLAVMIQEWFDGTESLRNFTFADSIILCRQVMYACRNWYLWMWSVVPTSINPAVDVGCVEDVHVVDC